MKKIILFILALSLYIQISFADKTIDFNTTMNRDLIASEDVVIGSHFELVDASIDIKWDVTIWSHASIDGDIEVDGDISIGSHINITGDIRATGDIFIWFSADIAWSVIWNNVVFDSHGTVQQKIYTNGKLKLWSHSTLERGVQTGWPMIVGSHLELLWPSKVFWDLTLWFSPNITDTLYVYGHFNDNQVDSHLDFIWSKFKITQDASFWNHSSLDGRIYIYWDILEFGFNYNENNTKYSGLFGRIDPLLQYNLSEVKIQSIRNKTLSYLQQADAETNQTKKKEIYAAMFSYLQTFIETEDFDQDIFTDIQREYTGVALEKNTSTQNAVIYTPMLPASLESRLDSLMKNIPEVDKIDTLSQISINIDTAIVRLKSTDQSASVIRKINILMWIQEYIEQEISEVQSDADILRELGF